MSSKSSLPTIHGGLILLAALSILVVCGCGDGRPERIPVSGRVVIDDKPLSGGTIRVFPESDRSATANIGPDGRFTLKTYEDGDGAVAGTHRVTIQATEDLGPTKIKWLAPKKYRDVRTSGLTITVKEATDNEEISLTWGGGKPFIETVQPEANLLGN